MPDLISHALTGFLARPEAGRRSILLTVAGTALPDLAGRAPELAAATFFPAWRFSTPDWVFDGTAIFHTLLPLALLCWVLSFAAPTPPARRQVFTCLLLGGWLHLGFDYLQRHLFYDYHPLYPLSYMGWEAEFFWTEDSLYYVLPPLAVLSLAAWLYRRRSPGRET